MGIKRVTSDAALNKLFSEAVKILSERVKYNLSYLGETCVRKVRDRSEKDSWCDQTGNLRSSVQYSIFQYGNKQIESAFETVLYGREGTKKAQELAKQIASEYEDCFNALVVYAAMEYAEDVEALENKDVLASVEIYAERNVDKYIRKALKEAEKLIQNIEIRL